jgi:hypothetical protein
VESLASEPIVLVQSALYPHAGYDARVVLLTRETLREPRYTGRAVVLAPPLDAYPLSKAEIEALARQGSQTASGDGIVVVRRP